MRRAFFIYCILWLANSAQAGAWVQPKGEGYASLQHHYFTSSGYYDAEGSNELQEKFTKYELQPYVEYGLWENLTIGATAYAQYNQQAGSEKLGIADPEFFARTMLFSKGSHRVSLQPLVKLKSLYRSEAAPRGGSTSYDAELSVLYGANMHILNPADYADLRIGYRARGTKLHDQWRADAAVGLQLTPQWQLVPALRYIAATHLEENQSFSQTGDLDYDLLKMEISAIYALNAHQHVQLGVAQHVAGRQTGDGTGFTLGFSQHF